MSVSARLVYDPAADASSHKVGSYVLAGTDGTQIGAVSDALKVNFSNASLAVTATDLDIRNLVFATDKVDVSGSSVELGATTLAALETITVLQGTSPWVIGDGGGSITVDGSVGITGTVAVTQSTSPWVVSATDLDIRDLSHLAGKDSVRLGDGTDLVTSTLSGGKQALDVYIANAGSIDIDDSLANTAIFTEARAVSTTAIALTAAAAIAGRKWLYVANEGNKSMYIGPSGVSAANGFPVHMGQQSEFRIGASVAPFIIGEAGSSAEDIRVMQLS